MSWDRIRVARAAHERTLLARANVVRLAVGRKVVGGEETDTPCVVVFVERKLPEADLRRRDIVPRALDGVPTDVVETGRFCALSLLEAEGMSRTSRIRPAPGGVSIGHVGVSAGTLGVLARREDGTRVILSNNHILANGNAARVGDPILQPGPADGGRPEDVVARLTAFVPIHFDEGEPSPLGRLAEKVLGPLLALAGLGLRRLPSGRANRVDAAIATPTSDDEVDEGILGIGRVEGAVQADIGLRVRKSGRTTGVTTGRVTAVDGVVQVDYGGRTALFRRQLVSDLRSRGGDSGSLVVDEERRAVGLLFAGSAVMTLVNPMDAVVEALHLRL